MDSHQYHKFVVMKEWFVVVNDLVGGHAIATVNKPLSEIETIAHRGASLDEGVVVADFVDEVSGQHIVDVHNEWLVRTIIHSHNEEQ